ncbi:MAG: class I SAM-dependent methyltransferase [Christensenellaceae bacterium]|jgi:SAM-dependent methyltransferase|nr:class I SAM-dependent methyltransferase [Christensenellaceae bacterium]
MKKFWAQQFRKPTGFGGKISTFLMNVINGPMYKVIERSVKQNSTILDIGFGNGYALKQLLKLSNSVFYGIDISADMQKLACRKNKKSIERGRLHLAEASVEAIPFKQSFGQIYTINTVYFWEDLKAGFQEVYSKLEPGGEFLNICYTKQWLEKTSFTQYGFAKYSEEELLSAAKEAGFLAELIPIKPKKSFYIKAVRPLKI